MLSDTMLTSPTGGREAQAVSEAQNLREAPNGGDPEKNAVVERVGELHEKREDVAEETAQSTQSAAETSAVQAASAEQATEGTPPTTIDTPPPTPSTAPAAPKEAGFMDKMTSYFDAAKSRGSNAFMAGLETFAFALSTGGSGLWDWVKETWGKMPWSKGAEDDSTEGNDGLVYRDDDEVFTPEDPDNQKLLSAAERQLQEVMGKNPTWIDFASEAGKQYGVSAASILAIARFESGFKAEAKASTSSAEGLGQFIKKTWASFIAANPNFSESKPSDPRAALHAIAWYSKKNAAECSIDLASADATGEVYLAHHEGAAGFKRMQAFKRGELTGDQIPAIPKSYKSKAFPKFGVAKVDTYQDYVTLVTSMASRVEAVADHYAAQLEAPAKPVS